MNILWNALKAACAELARPYCDQQKKNAEQFFQNMIPAFCQLFATAINAIPAADGLKEEVDPNAIAIDYAGETMRAIIADSDVSHSRNTFLKRFEKNLNVTLGNINRTALRNFESFVESTNAQNDEIAILRYRSYYQANSNELIAIRILGVHFCNCYMVIDFLFDLTYFIGYRR